MATNLPDFASVRAKIQPKPEPRKSGRPPAPAAQPGARAGLPPFLSGAIQLKARTVAAPTDPLEREADLVADQLAAPAPCPCELEGKPCPKCEAEIHRKAASSGGEPPKEGTAPRGGGTPLPGRVRREFESPLGIDLSGVRIHTGREASHMAANVDALAFTSGNHIVFGDGAWAPDTQQGKRLLAHELAHVRQNAPDRILRQPVAQAGPEEPQPKYKPPPKAVLPAGSDVYKFGADPIYGEIEPLLLAADDAYLEAFMRDLIAREGTNRAYAIETQLATYTRSWAYDLTPDVLEQAREDPDMAEDLGRVQLKKKIYFRWIDVFEKIHQEQQEFCAPLEEELRTTAFDMLTQSWQRTMTEKVRYGVTLDPGGMYGGDMFGGGQAFVSEMPSEGAGVTLAAAAKMLLTRRDKIYDVTMQRSLECMSDFCSPKGVELEEIEIPKLTEEYNSLYGFFVQQFPILGDFGALDSASDGLRQIAAGPSAETAGLLSESITKRLADIQKTRRGLDKGGEGDVWALDRLIEWTSIKKSIGKGSIQAQWIKEKVARERSSPSWKNVALGVISFALTLLAPVTLGLSLVGTAAISTYQAYESYRKYQFDKSMAHTDFDQARTIAAGEPSFFWVALDILFAAADIGMAAGAVGKSVLGASRFLKAERIYESVIPEVRAVKEGEPLTADVKEAIRQAAGTSAEGAAAAERIIHDLESGLNEGGALQRVFGLSEAEAESLFAKSGAWRKEIPEEELESVATAAAGRVKITKNGQLWVCASPCFLLREKYADVLAANEFGAYGGALVEEELSALEQRARTAAGSRNAQELFEVARDASHMEAALRAGRTAERKALVEQIGELRLMHPKMASLSDEALERVLAKGSEQSAIKGQLHEELQNQRLLESPTAMHDFVPPDVAGLASKGSVKLEYIPGHAVLDANGEMLTDGLIGYWKDGRFNIVTFFEAKAGRASSRGLRRKFTGLTRTEMEEAIGEARRTGIGAFRQADRQAADLLDHAAENYMFNNWKRLTGESFSEFGQRNAARIQALVSEGRTEKQAVEEMMVEELDAAARKRGTSTTDWLLENHESGLNREMRRLPQSEAGQLCKSKERLCLGEELLFYGQPTPIDIHGGLPHGVEVLPSGVSLSNVAKILQEGGLKSFQSLALDLSAAELDELANNIAQLAAQRK